MSDSLDRLYAAVIAARDLDPATSRTARLFQRGPSKMAKKLAEEAIEVVIDAVNGKTDAVIRESADLFYNLAVLWAAAGVRPEDVWAEMDRRERMLGIADVDEHFRLGLRHRIDMQLCLGERQFAVIDKSGRAFRAAPRAGGP